MLLRGLLLTLLGSRLLQVNQEVEEEEEEEEDNDDDDNNDEDDAHDDDDDDDDDDNNNKIPKYIHMQNKIEVKNEATCK